MRAHAHCLLSAIVVTPVLSLLFCFFVLSARAYRSEVAVTSSSPTPFVSLRGLFNTNQRSLLKQRADAPGSETRVRGGAAGAEL